MAQMGEEKCTRVQEIKCLMVKIPRKRTLQMVHRVFLGCAKGICTHFFHLCFVCMFTGFQ